MAASLITVPLLSVAQTPISLTGWNHDVIYEKTGSHSITSFLDPGGFNFAETGFVVNPAYKYNLGLPGWQNLGAQPVPFGLPSDGVINSLATNSVTGMHTSFLLENYSANNAALMKGGGDLVTLTLPTPQRFSSLAFLNTSTNSDDGTQHRIQVTLHFQGDPVPATFTFESKAWKQEIPYPVPDPLPPTSADTATIRMDRVHGTTIAGGADSLYLEQHKFVMYEADANLTSYGFDQKPIESITFEKVDNFTASDKYSAIFAVSGKALGNRNDFNTGTDLTNGGNYQLFDNSSIHRTPTANSDDVLLTTSSGPNLSINNANLTVGSLNITNSSSYIIENTTASTTSHLTLGTSSNSVSTSTSDLIYLGSSSGNLTIRGNTLGGGAINILLTRTGNLNVDNTNATLDVSASISGSGFGLATTGAGTVRLSGNNSYSGNTTVNAGTLVAEANGALGGTNAIMINTGGTLLLGGTVGNRVNDSAAVSITSGGTLRLGDSSAPSSEVLGALTLTQGSFLDFGQALGNFTAAFASLTLPEFGYATIVNWNGVPSQGAGETTDRLLFGGSFGATSTDAIRFDIGGTLHSTRFVYIEALDLYEALPNQVLAPIPEPTTTICVIAMLGLVACARSGRTIKCKNVRLG